MLRSSRFVKAPSVNPVQVETPAGLVIFRVFAKNNAIFMSTNTGLYSTGWHAPLGSTLFALECKFDGDYCSKPGKLTTSRLKPSPVPFFKVIKCITMSCKTSNTHISLH